MLDAITAIQRHEPATFGEFENDEVLRWFVLKQIEIIGEAVFRTSDALKQAHPGMPWSVIEKTRHIMVHDYWQVDWEKVWSIVTTHLAPLRAQLTALMEAGGESEGR